MADEFRKWLESPRTRKMVAKEIAALKPWEKQYLTQYLNPPARLKRRKPKGRKIRGKALTSIVIDEMEPTPDGVTALVEARRIAEYGGHLGEPVHPFVEDEISRALLAAAKGPKAEMWQPSRKP